jgi:type IV pilus assembly protein PilV
MRKKALCPTRRRARPIPQTGFSLVEVLVSIVILGLAMLGAAGLQLATMRSSQYSAQASVATQLVRDYEEITQLVRSADMATSEGSSLLTAVDTDTADGNAPESCFGSSADCTPAKLAAYMLADWKNRVRSDLPGGRAVVCRDSAPKTASGTNAGLYHWSCDNTGDMLMVKIGWTARADKNDAAMQAVAADGLPRVVMTIFGNQKDFTD